MTLPNYLTVGTCDGAYSEPCLLGETGLTLSGSQRPSAQLTAWLAGADIPRKARQVLETDLNFTGVTGLIRVPLECGSVHGIRAIWILARTATGLASIIVRDARSASEAQLDRDAAFVKQQASRYFARHAILLIQSQSTTERMDEFARFSAVYAHACPVTDQIYSMQADSDIGLSYAWLAPLVPTHGL
ncbi:hypothetical protein LMG28727_05268 [Paraburkholderia kirstenboschensis]|uniref:hypothetical protein n=1 Tax=Paraburkholderia kirstenboschensis TaxID=1245436 RepID=UPI000AA800F0|nr:hypothetical protein [Paraburkholderia kirstenboschensis]CAD6551656.1 hypothetical protein LMG28727_05268 [Paraburkholderia kirstenboschensis]